MTGWDYTAERRAGGMLYRKPADVPFVPIRTLPSTGTPKAVSPSLGRAFRTAGRINVNFRETPINEVVEFFRRVTGHNFVLDKTAVEELGGPENLLVTLTLNDVTVKSALYHTLTPLGLTWTIRHEAVFISTSDRIVDAGSTRLVIYDVGDLLLQPISGVSGPSSNSRR